MATPLDPMRHLQGLGAVPPVGPTSSSPVQRPEGKSFGQVLQEFVSQADQAQKQFDHAIEAVERGETDNLHQVMIAQSQAQMSLRLAAEVRNKMVEAYREVMRTQF